MHLRGVFVDEHEKSTWPDNPVVDILTDCFTLGCVEMISVSLRIWSVLKYIPCRLWIPEVADWETIILEPWT